MILPTLFVLSLLSPQAEPEPPLPEPAREIVIAEITAYSSSEDETDDTPHVNAAGTRPDYGSIACPRYYPLGTEFIIEGIRYTCDDRMSTRFPHRFDLWKPSKEAALQFGVQTMDVQVIREG